MRPGPGERERGDRASERKRDADRDVGGGGLMADFPDSLAPLETGAGGGEGEGVALEAGRVADPPISMTGWYSLIWGIPPYQ